MPDNRIEISIKGKWTSVPALQVGAHTIVARGGWINLAGVHDEEWLEMEVEDPELYVKQLKEQSPQGMRADIFTFTHKSPSSKPQFKYPMEWSSVAAIRLTDFNAWWEKLPQETRKNVRRSQKRGVIVGIRKFDDALVSAISDVNNDSPMRQKIRNVHYGKPFDQVKKDYSAFVDRSDFICACVNNEVIGFLKLVYRGEVASILNLTTKQSAADKRPANALIAKAVELCLAKRVSFLTYGQFNYGNKRHSPLREFKIRNGFEEVLKPRYYIPLTRWGTVCMKMKLHRGPLGILPHRLIALGVDLRTKWYNFAQFLSRCSSMLERPNRTRQMERSIPPAGSKE
jgi:hypothetical protein